MTKKDYILIAETIREINMRKATGDRIIELFSKALATTNPKFIPLRFEMYAKYGADEYTRKIAG